MVLVPFTHHAGSKDAYGGPGFVAALSAAGGLGGDAVDHVHPLDDFPEDGVVLVDVGGARGRICLSAGTARANNPGRKWMASLSGDRFLMHTGY